MSILPGLKIAIVCDWLTGVGGAERVVLELHRLFPEAPIYTSQYDPSKIDWFNDAHVRTTKLQKLPFGFKKFLPIFRAKAFRKLDLSQYDVVISSSGAEAKGVKTDTSTIHICYCHAPTHYYWSRYQAYLQHPGFGKLDWLARIGLKLFVGPLRKQDYKAAQRPSYLVANSTHTQEEIRKYYDRESTVIYPPVETERFAFDSTTARQGFVTAGRQTPYKQIDLAVKACTKLGLPLTVIGDGPDHQKLVDAAGPSITFVTKVNDQQMAGYFKSAQAFIFPGLDDFGIVAVEAMAAGTPVIAYKGGGALDYVIPGQTGDFFYKQTVESLCDALQAFKPGSFYAQSVAEHAQRFSVKEFRKTMESFLSSVIKVKA